MLSHTHYDDRQQCRCIEEHRMIHVGAILVSKNNGKKDSQAKIFVPKSISISALQLINLLHISLILNHIISQLTHESSFVLHAAPRLRLCRLFFLLRGTSSSSFSSSMTSSVPSTPRSIALSLARAMSSACSSINVWMSSSHRRSSTGDERRPLMNRSSKIFLFFV